MDYRFVMDPGIHDRYLQPYGLDVEKSSFLSHDSIKIVDGRLQSGLSGNRYLLRTPLLTAFSLRGDVQFAFPESGRGFWLYFGYSEEKRDGLGALVSFEDGRILVDWMRLEKGMTAGSVRMEQPLTGDLPETVPFELMVAEDGKAVLIAADRTFEISGLSVERGRVGFGRKGFAGDMSFGVMTLEAVLSEDAAETLSRQRVTLPLLCGGAVPYRLDWTLVRYDGNLLRLECMLSGGCRERKNTEKGSNYRAEVEWFTDPRIVLIQGGDVSERFLKNGKLVFCAPQIANKRLYEYYGAQREDLTAALDTHAKDGERFIGLEFDYFEIDGYHMQSRGAAYLFDETGRLVYSGEPLKETVCEVTSPAEKALIARLDPNWPRSGEAKRHLENNHYFLTGEDAEMTLEVRTRRSTDWMRAEAVLQNATADEIRPLAVMMTDAGDCDAPLTGYHHWKACVKASPKDQPLGQGVYRIRFTLYYGDSVLETRETVFEMIDPDSGCSPAQSSGLPILFSTPTEQMFLRRDMFDPFQIAPDCMAPHFYSLSCFFPSAGEDCQIWRYLPLFKRKWYSWMTGRTEAHYTAADHRETVRHADYLNYSIYDVSQNENTCSYIWRMSGYVGMVLEELHRFVNERGLDDIGFDADGRLTKAGLRTLLTEHYTEWHPVFSNFVRREIGRTNEELKAINPAFRRAGYGPWAVYAAFYKTQHFLTQVGYREEGDLENIFTGFCQFEDYPWWGLYHTYIGGWAAETMKLFNPGARIYPEIFGNTHAYSADGVVKTSNPPFGERMPPSFAQVAQSYEYAFATPIRRPDGYDYWRDYGFQLRDFPTKATLAFAEGWGEVLRHRPVKPVCAPAVLCEFDSGEDAFDESFLDPQGTMNAYNISEENTSYTVYRTRDAGFSAPYAMKFESLANLKPEEAAFLVVPSTRNRSQSEKDAIRRLSEAGVPLVGTGFMDGLEDLFGAAFCERTAEMTTVCAGGEREPVAPVTLTSFYAPEDGTQVLVSGGGLPILLRHGRNLLLCAPVGLVGKYVFPERFVDGRPSLSKLLAETMKAALRDVAGEQAVIADGGLAAFEDEHGQTVLAVTNYANTDPLHTQDTRTVRVTINIPCRTVESRHPITCLRGETGVKAVEVTLFPEESAVLVLQ